MAHHDRDLMTQRLGDLMSDLQERCFCASWMCVTPEIVGLCRRALKTGQPQPWGISELAVPDARAMWELAEELGGWANLDPNPDHDGYIIDYPFISLDSETPEAERISWADAPPDPREST